MPEFDPVAQRCRIAEIGAEGMAELCDLWERSPVRLDESHNWTADDWIDWLFPDAVWLCLAKDHPATARSRKKEKWTFGPADECSYIVPSPMTGPSGNGLGGRRSHRCLDNTGPRRWLVIEFDPKGWEALSPAEQKWYRNKANYYRIKINEQARLHWHFRESALAARWPPLRLVVHSGSKSAHGWYGPVQSEEIAHELMCYAVSLGADTSTWTRCQLVRLPGGRRKIDVDPSISLPDWGEPEGFTRLQVFYFDPEGITQ